MSVRKLKPSKQGQLDGACGFYSIVNAIYSLEPDFDRDEIFAQAYAANLLDGDPMNFIDGTRRGTIKNVLSRVIDFLHEYYELTDNETGNPYRLVFKMPFWHLDKNRDRKAVLNFLKQADNEAGIVCIIGYEYKPSDDVESHYYHWSVVTKATEKGLEFFDSGNEDDDVSYDKIRVDGQQNFHIARPYNITSSDLFVISRQPL